MPPACADSFPLSGIATAIAITKRRGTLMMWPPQLFAPSEYAKPLLNVHSISTKTGQTNLLLEFSVEVKKPAAAPRSRAGPRQSLRNAVSGLSKPLEDAP